MTDPSPTLCRLGHVATAHQLAQLGITARQLHRAIVVGSVWRPRRGTYACRHIDTDLGHAARLGGALTCASVLRRLGIWAGFGGRVHIQVAPTAGRVLTRLDGNGLPPRLHWHEPRFAMASRWLVSPEQALWQAMHCLDAENAIAAMESAVHQGVLPAVVVRKLADAAPRRLGRDIRHLTFRSGSGNESIVRLRLQRAGYRVESQAHVPGLGHQDLLVEDVLGLEVDGREFHDTPEQFVDDRDRDLHAAALRRQSLRLRPAHVTKTWDFTFTVIERMVADGLAERARRNGRRFPLD